jgi:hypothetical protein
MANKDEPSQQAENTAGAKPAAQGREVGKKARQWAMFCHIAGLAWMLWWLAPVIGGVVGTLIVWQVKKDDDPFIDQHGKRALNFQLSMLLYAAALCLTIIGVFLTPVVGILDIVFTIIAALRASDGKDYQYPLTIPFIK